MTTYRIELAESDPGKVVGIPAGYVFEVSTGEPAFVGDSPGACLRLNDPYARERYLSLEVQDGQLLVRCHSKGRGAWVLDVEAFEHDPATRACFLKGLRTEHVDASVPDAGGEKLWIRGQDVVLSVPAGASARLRHPDPPRAVGHGGVILLPGVQLRVSAHPSAGAASPTLQTWSHLAVGPKVSSDEPQLPALAVEAAQLEAQPQPEHATTLPGLVTAIGGALLRRRGRELVSELGSLPEGHWSVPPILLGDASLSLDELVDSMLRDRRPLELPVALLMPERASEAGEAKPYSFLTYPDEADDWVLSFPLKGRLRGCAFMARVWRRFSELRASIAVASSGPSASAEVKLPPIVCDRSLHSSSERASLVPGTLESFGGVRSRSPWMHELFEKLRKVAESELRILLTGESGTGKTFIARAIHDASPRRCRPYVSMNCAAIPQGLAESELFGHERGAFTGADKRKDGVFHAADGGTIFLDEIGEFSEEMQVKLLKTVESGHVRRVGSTKEESVDVRVIAATNRNLKTVGADGGRFRDDLYYRLAGLEVRVPPLRERLEDIDLIAADLLAAKMKPGAGPKVLGDDAIEKLRAYDFPGNIRELENILGRASTFAAGEIIHADDIELPVRSRNETARLDGSSAIARQLLESVRKTLANESGTIDCAVKGHDQQAAYRQAVAFILKEWEKSGELERRHGLRTLPYVLDKEASRRLQGAKLRAFEYLRDLYPELTEDRYADQVARVRGNGPRAGSG